MRILLVQPAPFEDRRLGLENTVWLSEPVSLTSIGAMAPDHDVEIVDMRLEDPRALSKKLVSFQPDIVGTTAMTTDAYQAKAVLRITRQLLPDALTLIGGHYPTFLPEEYREGFVDVIFKGEGELGFRELLDRWSADRQKQPGARQGRDCLLDIAGTEVRTEADAWVDSGKRPWARKLDELPAPNRGLIHRYQGQYFFLGAAPMASIFTSRGCSFDCNFCAIWEFYDRKTRFLSAKAIADRMEACDEPFLFFLDDNFLSRTDRLVQLCDEIEERGIKKHWMSQGRADFVAANPELIARLARNGLMGLLSGYETNDEDALAGLNKRSTLDANKKAAKILRDNGVISTGIFMVRPEFEEKDFDALYQYILDLRVAIPLVTVLTPLPGTEMWRKKRSELLTEDLRLFDLLHAVTETRLPREEFYKNYVRWKSVGHQSRKNYFDWKILWMRRSFYRKAAPNLPRMIWRRLRYERIQFDHKSYLRDEDGIIGVGSRARHRGAK